MLLALDTWVQLRDGDREAFRVFERHYSFRVYADGRRRPGYRNRFQFVGPGEKLVLMTPAGDALFVWRRFRDDSGQQGVNCAAFRNEGTQLSSELIQAAEIVAWERWPKERRLYTYINPRKLRGTNPGYCFLMAGWRKCGVTKWNRLVILEKFRPSHDRRYRA